jgi:polyisoprenyl-phosphate glycosyltransferase
MIVQNTNTPPVSIIIPIWNEEGNILPLYKAIIETGISIHEFIFVDDGSTDQSLAQIETLSAKDPNVKAISFSRNFGHQAALIAGMHSAKAEVIIIMDGDLQHPPAVIPSLLKKYEEGFDLVSAKRIDSTQTGVLKKWSSSLYYRLLNFMAETHIEENVADFRVFNRKVLDAILQFNETEVFVRGIFSWIGFKTATVPFDPQRRNHGKSKYSWGRMMSLGVKGAVSFSFKPLRISLLAGSIVSLIAFAFGIFSVVSYYQGKTLPGWTSIITAIMFLGGVQLIVLGLIGEYIASMFKEVKKRPLFIVDRKINC